MAISNRAARKIKKGIGSRVRSKEDAMTMPAGYDLPPGVKLYIPHSRPKPAIVDPDEYKKRKKR